MTERILLIEPAASVARLVKQELEAAGMEVLDARDTQTAYSLLKTKPTDLVLIETNLFASGGLEMVVAIRRSKVHSRLPLVILGSHDGSDQNVRWLEAGADSTIPRPYSAPVLVARLRALLRRVQKE